MRSIRLGSLGGDTVSRVHASGRGPAACKRNELGVFDNSGEPSFIQWVTAARQAVHQRGFDSSTVDRSFVVIVNHPRS